jgi:plasmid maintenance system antidote protein VapI
LARDIGVPTDRVTGILHGTRAVTADTAIRLGLYFRTSPEFWMNLQQMYDLRATRQAISDVYEAIKMHLIKNDRARKNVNVIEDHLIIGRTKKVIKGGLTMDDRTKKKRAQKARSRHKSSPTAH